MSAEKKFLHFLNIGYPERVKNVKPRKIGRTMLIDWAHFSLLELEERLKTYADYIDVAKLLIPNVLNSEEWVKRKIDLYKKYGIEIQHGGLQGEIAFAQNNEDEFFENAKELGITHLEISDSIQPWTIEQKCEFIKLSVRKGFKVNGEIGRYVDFSGDRTMLAEDSISVEGAIEEIKLMLDAGAYGVNWESLIMGKVVGTQLERKGELDKIMEVANAVGPENIIFEVSSVPPYEQATRFWLWYVIKFGPNVNIGNCRFEWILDLEATRRGLGVPSYPWIAEQKRRG